MTGFRGLVPEIRYGTGYATVLTFRQPLDIPDGYSEPRVAALVRHNASTLRTASALYGHDQRLAGTVRRIPRADRVEGARTISGWPAWRAWLVTCAWRGRPWRWVYQAGTYGGGSTYFDAELESPEPEWPDGPEVEANGQRRLALVIVRANGSAVTASAVEGY